MAVLEGENIIKIYEDIRGGCETKALNRISFKIDEGEFVGIMGSSGSGKTTLLNILSGVDKITSGKVKIWGKDINNMNKSTLAIFRRQNLGFIFQEFNLLDTLTMKENIMLPMILDKKAKAYMDKKVKDIMEAFNIYDIKDKYPYNVSGGQQQRVAISRAIVNDPKIVFADEPTGNLDSKSAKDIMMCFEKMNKEMNNTILVVTHDVFAASYCNRIIFIKDGRLHSEIVKKSGRKEFLEDIMNSLAVLGGDRCDF